MKGLQTVDCQRVQYWFRNFRPDERFDVCFGRSILSKAEWTGKNEYTEDFIHKIRGIVVDNLSAFLPHFGFFRSPFFVIIVPTKIIILKSRCEKWR